ncbi:MAG: aminotransferase class I/II-fold pyridoxal phosphate-dependent enzyme [Gordonibacter pamelaeae]|uniref:Aminotransferase class I/II-fold pyridoxal phosphate-dependent enzyme n=2 Tax=Gordonibacter TaxID=644652 RepID=A0A7K0ID43_9ACTN|nr:MULTISPECIES: histidinol-phosphate transaminase [Gordonibacter]HJH75070.1 histidinol-phosphate aminotransferase family protein [Eggerthellaceae bacterium]MBS4894443.1 aminotransferase class I/II-fold pyridoxal phosphate-dependent enzyme [Gordonibacter pamelaeae]MCB7087034.1 histidinol-phosphate aminotransferase family protein [Gordonibacter urolithinfaciens]MCQ4846934.1 histidinol-phosphate aminotransferase family protein [Gordonibacter pamelaeae]MCQ4851201.1 histidinol-phosphate aminotrans
MSNGCDATPGVRAAVTALPEQLLSPPYELRTEMNWIDFSGTANPLGTPPSFIRAMQAALAAGELNYSPDREAHTLRSVLARQHGLPVESFLVGSTVGDMVRAVAQTYQPCTVGVAVPGPVEYALAAGNAGHRVVEITSPAGFVMPDPAAAARHGVSFDAAVLANPGYPTSRLLPLPTLLAYLDACTWVVVDERSIELTLGGESMVGLVKEHRNLVVVRSLCEPYAMPGIPISYCVAHPDTIAQIARFYDSSGVPMFAEVLGELALAEREHLERTREFLDSEIPWMQCMLSLVPGIDIFPAEANYVMCAFDHGPDLDLGVASTEELAARLQLAGFLIRKLQGTPGLTNGKYFCVAVRTREDNEKLIAALREIIAGC